MKELLLLTGYFCAITICLLWIKNSLVLVWKSRLLFWWLLAYVLLEFSDLGCNSTGVDVTAWIAGFGILVEGKRYAWRCGKLIIVVVGILCR